MQLIASNIMVLCHWQAWKTVDVVSSPQGSAWGLASALRVMQASTNLLQERQGALTARQEHLPSE